ncbi:MAG TPA: lytic transglycosylase domain-containing protein [Gaiellaceae bacterium]|nr:lytic transglycosylase domain-containing protein [Gaiellaceae bacterium]
MCRASAHKAAPRVPAWNLRAANPTCEHSRIGIWPTRTSDRRDRRAVRRGRLAALAALVAIATALVLVAAWSLDGGESTSVLVPREDVVEIDALAYNDSNAEELERRAAFGFSQPLYAKSPGGVVATARRTESYRPLVEDAVADSGFDADLVEAMVFLESGGRPDVIAGDDPAGASGLTQILAETARNFLAMDVDLDGSRRLTVQIAGAERRGNARFAELLRERRRAIDARFDPRQALAGTVRYLTAARERLGRDDLAVVSYHMGIGNLTNVLRAYASAPREVYVPDLVEEEDLSWPRVFFDTAPDRNESAHELLAPLGDDSPTYYWRVLAAREIMRLFRDDPDRLQELDLLHRAKTSHEEVLHPPAETERFADPVDVQRAWDAHTLQPFPNEPARLGFAVDRTMGELAVQLGQPKELYRGLRAEALALLVYMAGRVKEISGTAQPLEVTSTVRDETYQELLRDGNPEATHGYSLHTTGYAFDVRRRYESGAQAQAFQFVLDDLTARGLIAWIREPAAIHVTVAPEAEDLVPIVLKPED